jgi:Ran-binding protein 1
LLSDSGPLRVSSPTHGAGHLGIADSTDANLFKEAFESAQEKNAASGGGAAESDAEDEEEAEIVPVAVS